MSINIYKSVSDEIMTKSFLTLSPICQVAICLGYNILCSYTFFFQILKVGPSLYCLDIYKTKGQLKLYFYMEVVGMYFNQRAIL